LVFFSFLYATDASADGMFSQLNSAGETIFKGLSQIIFKAAGIGVACVCIAGMFGNFNWKWLAAILIGVFIIGMAVHGGVDQGVDMFAGD
jgi:type IV secretory pathway VirB2 component (pilin)